MRYPILWLLLATMLVPLAANSQSTSSTAVTDEDFALKDTSDLVTLCGASEDDPLYERAVVFCLGFVTGAMNFYGAMTHVPDFKPFVCSDQVIPRYEMVKAFLEWAKLHPEHMSDPAVESGARAAASKWPCTDKTS